MADGRVALSGSLPKSPGPPGPQLQGSWGFSPAALTAHPHPQGLLPEPGAAVLACLRPCLAPAPGTRHFFEDCVAWGLGWDSHGDLFTAGCDSVKWIFFFSFLRFFFGGRGLTKAAGSPGLSSEWGHWTPWTQTLPWGSWVSLGGGVPRPARDLTSAGLPRGAEGGGAECGFSRLLLPAGTLTMKVKEVGRGGGPDSRPVGPAALGKPPPPGLSASAV